MKHYSILLMAMTLAFVSSLQAALPVTENASTPHARAYQFSFVQGNLLANWSFEDGYYFWALFSPKK